MKVPGFSFGDRAVIRSLPSGRVQVDIAQVKEILARLADLIGENPEVEARFMKYVKQREFKARKKKMIKEKYK